MSNLATTSPVQRLHLRLLCHCGEEAVMAYGFPGQTEQAVCEEHEKGLVLRREIEPGRALAASVRRFDTVPGPETSVTAALGAAHGEHSEEVEYLRNRVIALCRFLDEHGLADPTVPPPPTAEQSKVE